MSELGKHEPKPIDTDTNQLQNLLVLTRSFLHHTDSFTRALNAHPDRKWLKSGLVSFSLLLALASYGCAARPEKTINPPTRSKPPTMVPIETMAHATAQVVATHTEGKFYTSLKPKGEITQDQINKLIEASSRVLIPINSKGGMIAVSGETSIEPVHNAPAIFTTSHEDIAPGFTPKTIRIFRTSLIGNPSDPGFDAKLITFYHDPVTDISIAILDPAFLPPSFMQSVMTIAPKPVDFSTIDTLVYGSLPSTGEIQRTDSNKIITLLGDVLINPIIKKYPNNVIGMRSAIGAPASSGGFVATPNTETGQLDLSGIIFGAPDQEHLNINQQYELRASPLTIDVARNLANRAYAKIDQASNP